jgi:4-amino-4-deoxy-L-arabinose transferase-like glycosyltransferase
VAANPPGRKLIAFFTGRWLDRVGLTVGLLLLVIGEALVWLADENTIKAGSALLASGAIVTFVFIGLRQQERREIGLAAPTRTEWLILSVITLLALAMRVYRLDEVLYGLFRDEARFGLLGLRVLDDPTYHPIYEGPPIHQSGFYLYLLAIAFRLLGASIFSLRLVSAVAGALLVPVVWWMAREWFRDARVALVAAFGLAISAMHVSNSRFAVPYVESTLLSIPAYVFLTRGFEGGRLRDYALAGFFFGVTQYTSQISRVALVFGAILVLDEIITRHAWPPNLLRGAFVLVVVALLVLTPLLSFIVQNPAAYFARTTQVYALNPDYTWGEYPLTVLWNNVLAYAGMFNVTGNSLGGRILPAYPELDPVFGVLLLVGLAGTLTRLQESAHRRVVLWFMTALLTGLITVDAPNPLRVLEVTAPTFILTGLAFVSLKDIFNSLTSSKLRTRAFACATLTLMFAALAVNYAVYFIDKGGDPRIWSRNQVFGSMIGHTLNQWRSQNLIASDTIVYAPDWFVEQHNEQDAFNFTTNSQFKLLPFSKYSGYFSPHIMIVRPNELGDWELLSERAPFYKAFGKQVIEGDNQDQAQVQSLLGDRAALELRGPNFPQSDKPTFWAYVLE